MYIVYVRVQSCNRYALRENGYPITEVEKSAADATRENLLKDVTITKKKES